MANCSDCGKKIPMFDGGRDGRCYTCSMVKYDAEMAPIRAKEAEDASARERLEAQQQNAIESVIVTTEAYTNLIISKRIKIVIATVESSFDAKLVEKQDELVFGLKTECHAVGGNAVVGVTFNIIETYSASIGAGNFKKFKMVAYGTAVEVEM
jgi:uncharacterized protein YbjQ (UPF0145 family)